MSEKPKILFYSQFGASLPIAWRLRRMGYDVAVFVEGQKYDPCYEGIIKGLGIEEVKPAMEQCDVQAVDTKWVEVLSREAQRIMKKGSRLIFLSELLEDFTAIQNHYMMDGDLGPAVVCQGSQMNHGPGPGEATADSIYGMLSLTNDWANLLSGGPTTRRAEYCASQRITIGPYPYANIEGQRVEIHNDIDKLPWFWAQDVCRAGGKWMSAGADGLLGVVTGLGKTPNEAWGRCYQHIKSLSIDANVQYRRDGLRSARREVDKKDRRPQLSAVS